MASNHYGDDSRASAHTEHGHAAEATQWNALVGPFFDTAGLTRWHGISRQAVHQKVATHELLACPTADGGSVYPTWQFLPNGATIPALAEVVSTLAQGTDDAWLIALWMQARSDLLDGNRPSSWLRKGGDPQRVIAMALAGICQGV